MHPHCSFLSFSVLKALYLFLVCNRDTWNSDFWSISTFHLILPSDPGATNFLGLWVTVVFASYLELSLVATCLHTGYSSFVSTTSVDALYSDHHLSLRNSPSLAVCWVVIGTVPCRLQCRSSPSLAVHPDKFLNQGCSYTFSWHPYCVVLRWPVKNAVTMGPDRQLLEGL